MSGQPFYSLTEWNGTKVWTKSTNIIPEFHLKALENGYLIRYHVQIPLSYLDQFPQAEQEEEKNRIQRELDAVLSGAENAHKSFYSFINDKIPNAIGWKIEKIDTDLKDESYLKLFETASKVHARGHGINPILAGIEDSGSLSSGSEILNLINYHIAYKTPRMRKLCLRPLVMWKNYNFPDKKKIKIGVEDVVLTTQDKNKSGVEQKEQ